MLAMKIEFVRKQLKRFIERWANQIIFDSSPSAKHFTPVTMCCHMLSLCYRLKTEGELRLLNSDGGDPHVTGHRYYSV